MFAEELGANAGRKRAEANRAKRRQIKEKQQHQKPPTTATTAATSAVQLTDDSHAVPGPPLISSDSASVVAVVSSGASAPAPTFIFSQQQHPQPQSQQQYPKSALERANEQRALRATEAQQQKSAVRIQSHSRRFLSNLRLRELQVQQLTQKLGDLQTLSGILYEKKGIRFVPPPATTTSLVRTFLWLAHEIGGNGTRKIRSFVSLQPQLQSCFQSLVDLCLLPGVKSVDANINPCAVWIESKEGRWRFQRLLHVSLVMLMEPKTSDPCFASVLNFLKEITGASAAKINTTNPKQPWNHGVVFARSILSGRTADVLVAPLKSELKRGEMVSVRLYEWSSVSSVDLVALLRYFLCFVVAAEPIPAQAEAQRQACISDETKQRAGALLQWVFEYYQQEEEKSYYVHHLRLFTHIFTVPLLTWKISSDALSFLLTPLSSSKTSPFLELEWAFHSRVDKEVVSWEHAIPSEDLPMTLCPATNTQCLLANLGQMGRLSNALNGSSLDTIQFDWTRRHVTVLTVLLDVVPVRTFTTRESAVVWITSDTNTGHATPIVLSMVVLDQCKSVFVDSYIRGLFSCAIDSNRLDMEHVLQSKNDKDNQMEQDIVKEGGSSATAMAAKEARVDRNQSFWNSSKWARKVSKRVVGLLSSSTATAGKSGDFESGSVGGGVALTNISSQSKALAAGDVPAVTDSAVSSGRTRDDYSPELLISLCDMFSVVLARWGGGGGRDDVGGKDNKPKSADKEIATSLPEPFTLAILNVLCFSTQIVKAAWCLIQSHPTTTAGVQAVIDPEQGNTPVRKLSCVIPAWKVPRRGASVLYLFTATLSHALIVTDDVEIHDLDRPLPLHQLRRVIKVLKKLLYRACFLDVVASPSAGTPPNYFGLALISASSRAFRDLYDRSSRRPLCHPKVWLVASLLEKEINSCKTNSDYVSLLNSAPVLRICPMLVSFKRRLALFDKIVRTNREDLQGVNTPNPFNPNPLKPARVAVINRGRVLEDGLATMNHLGSRMRERISVHYINEAGTKETGIDAGGLFKEFWTDLCAIAFNPNYALFQVTEGAEKTMFPSPMSSSAHGRDHIVLFEFLGRILGKALYEGITIQPRFAHFFLSFLRGDYNFLHMLPDLSTIDPQLYNNLMFLKTYDGDASDLCLTFTITSDEFGGTKEIPLIPRGADVDVTNSNKQRYIGLVAKYYVVDRVKEQSEAFTRGLWEVIDPSWLRLLNEPELQVLISGASDGKIDVDDLRRNTRYAGGYTAIDLNVTRFWSAFASLDGKQQAALLRFVTSCERPPPLGFASLNPPFTIQRVGIMRDGDKLPSASTCFNVLKLPTYSSEKVLKQRLLYAIQSGAGFELT